MKMNKPYFPLCADLSAKQIRVIGGGRIGTRRTLALIPFCENITVYDEKPSAELIAAENKGEIRLVRENFDQHMLDGADIVLACTNDPEINNTIYELCKSSGIPVNICSDKSKCDFYFPGIVRKDNVVVGITASGEAHSKARAIREEFEKILDEYDF